MNIRKALDILGISTIDNNVLNTAKKRYRQLARKYHPDLTGNDRAATLKMEELNEAYETLKSTSQKIKAIADSKTDLRESIIISLGDLENIFMGKSVTIGNKQVSKQNIGRFRVFIDFDIKYSYLGITHEKNVTQLRNTDDKYIIDLSVMLEKSEAVDVEIKLQGKKIQFNLASSSVRLSLTYNCNIIVTLIVNRKLIVSDKK